MHIQLLEKSGYCFSVHFQDDQVYVQPQKAYKLSILSELYNSEIESIHGVRIV